MRQAQKTRKTQETDIEVFLNLDGEGKADVHSGIGFFDHMLTAFSKHAKIDLGLRCNGDLDVDGHHSVEDSGIVLGEALLAALGDKKGIYRIGESTVPMDEAIAFCALDLSARPYLKLDVEWTAPMIGGYDAQLTREFLRALCTHAGITLHMQIRGDNAHHMAEAAYKALGRALRKAIEKDPKEQGIPSTKGVL